ncbi:hypothetical protein CUJ83_12885 [Methanocella sp. CWC-04]|uniref:WD40-like Beta Propeller Repeat n=1 Tax=Methanooceanicella nereidis TaxID=2052831 RepID=A0AAP2RDY3_9EURY|nr:DPP IV N-terminal domain-containing protein [Methanocella sp. CWC-04]MCD1295891.1 hypothetical protein [Methanocella sp. CWC-04]
MFRYPGNLCMIMMIAVIVSVTGCFQETTPSVNDNNGDIWKDVPNEKIVFMSKADSSSGELYLQDRNGITRLTNNDRHENNPALSPDGKKVAFHAGDINDLLSWDIYVLDLETGEETRLTDNRVIDGHPDWSPDCTKLVFGSFRDAQGNPSGAADIYVINIDGTGLKRLTDSPYEDNDPEWSPDGTKIAFKSTRDTLQSAREEIYVMDSDGSNIRKLTTTSGSQSDHDPSWSPDSSEIVFTRYEGSRPWTDIVNTNILIENWKELTPWNVYKVDLGGNTEKLTNLGHMSGLPVFSGDGKNILYLKIDLIIIDGKAAGATHRLILIKPDGTGEKQLISDNVHTPTLEYYDW